MQWKNKGWWLLTAFVVSVLAFAFLYPQPVQVEVAVVKRGTFIQTVDEDGKTRVRERYTVSAPLAGVLERIRLKVGDPVEPGMILAIIHPHLPALLDERTQQELQERLGAAEATQRQTQTEVERAYATLKQARVDFERIKALADEELAAPAQRDQAELKVTVATKDWTAAKFENDTAKHQVEMARAALWRARNAKANVPTTDQEWKIYSPIVGRVLQVWQESEGSVAVGAPLLEVADPSDLEIVVDVLTTDAVHIQPGAKVWLERWGGKNAVEGRVRVVEPSAFTKISALGVEEQRVNVVINVVASGEQWKAVGDGYRVEARIEIFRQDDAVKIPTGALFREGENWAVFVIVQGRAQKRIVQVDHRNGVAAMVEKGVAPGEHIIVYPSDAVENGVRVAAR